MRILFFLVCMLPFPSLAKFTVVASIEPLYKLTAEIMRGAGEPELLIDSGASAHHFSFRPSHFRLLKEADLMIWIERNFESGFQRIPEILNDSSGKVELHRDLAVKHSDKHIWYSPVLLPRMIALVGAKLEALDPEHRTLYQTNQQRFQQAVAQWWQSSREQLRGVKPRYLLDHDFLHHFEAASGFSAVAVLNDGHDHPIGMASVLALEEKLKKGAVQCLLSNEPVLSELGQRLAEAYHLQVELIGFGGASDFMTGLNHLSQALVRCGQQKD